VLSDTARCVEAHMPIDGIDLPADPLLVHAQKRAAQVAQA